MNIYKYCDYKEFVREEIRAMPERGRGQYQKLAKHLRVHSTLVSQIFNGGKDLTPEQACGLSEYFALGEPESEYLLTLVHRARAETPGLRRLLDRKLEAFRAEASAPPARNRRPAVALSEHVKSTFYSSWYYAGIWQLTAIPEYQTTEALVQYTGLPRPLVRKVVEFLLFSGMCEEREGRIVASSEPTIKLEDSTFVGLNLANWRLRAIERFPQLAHFEKPAHVQTSRPVAISKKDARRVQELIFELSQKIEEIARDSTPEVAYTLNLDWFSY